MGHRRIAIGLACAVLLGSGMLVGVSQAQDAPPSPPPGTASSLPHERGPGPHIMRFRGDGPGHDGPRSGWRGVRGERGEPGKHIEGRIAFLKAELKITDAQNRAWDQYATFMRETAKTRQAMFDKREAEMKARRGEPGKRSEEKPLLTRLDEQEERAKAALQAVEKRKAATQALYKVLSDEQKKLLEDLF